MAPSALVVLARFAALSLLPIFALAGLNLGHARILGPTAYPFLAVVWLEYTLLYLAAAMALPLLLALALPDAPRAVSSFAVATTSLAGFYLFADATIFRMFGFHWNSFVNNLLFTPGGIESMDGGTRIWIEGGAALLALVALQLGLRSLALRELPLWHRLAPQRPRRAALAGVALLVLVGGGERVAFAVCNFTGHRPVTVCQDVFPHYLRTRMRRLAVAMGFDRKDDIGMSDVRGTQEPRYPLAPLQRAPDAKSPNIVWLVAESWRGDTLTPDLMPATWAFAQRAAWFRNHYSGGNCTRMGVFSMFYGLYGSYWFPFRSARRGPVLVDLLKDGGWQCFLSTSARFTFPEFDETVWSRFPMEELTEGDGKKLGWENDRALSDRMLERIDARDRSRPFFAFHFFESPHAQYHFPPECLVREPVCDVVDYAFLSAADMPKVKNRYLNAVNHLDTQFAKVLRHLEEQGLLDSTIVVLTGDHGEEFMEKGRYGHHSTFSEEQTRPALVLWVPGMAPRVVDTLSSHLDLAPTVLAQLGVTNDPLDYCLGVDLLGDTVRDHVVLADWDHLCIRDALGKGSFPLAPGGLFDWEVTEIDDGPIADRDAWKQQAAPLLGRVAKLQRRFTR